MEKDWPHGFHLFLNPLLLPSRPDFVPESSIVIAHLVDAPNVTVIALQFGVDRPTSDDPVNRSLLMRRESLVGPLDRVVTRPGLPACRAIYARILHFLQQSLAKAF